VSPTLNKSKTAFYQTMMFPIALQIAHPYSMFTIVVSLPTNSIYPQTVLHPKPMKALKIISNPQTGENESGEPKIDIISFMAMTALKNLLPKKRVARPLLLRHLLQASHLFPVSLLGEWHPSLTSQSVKYLNANWRINSRRLWTN
jgi:hypothetical protein